MSDAREEAIEAVLAAGVPVSPGSIANVIDAIPGHLHAKIAIDEGGLEPAARDVIRSAAPSAMLYRLVEEGE